MNYTYTTLRHPKSGEDYAVALHVDTIVLAAGPLHHSDPRTAEWIANYVLNANDGAETADWLQEELNATA